MGEAGYIVHFEGRLVPAAEATISVLGPAVTRGPVAYETLRAYWNEDDGELYIFRLGDHLRRLRTSMRILRFRDLFDDDDLTRRLTDVVRANGFREDIHFRLFVYPREQERARYATTSSGLVIEARPRPEKQKSAVSCQVSSWRRGGDDNQPARVKAMGIRLFARAAMDQAIADGYDQLILLNERGKVSESVSSNIFMVRQDIVVTPEATASLLEGVTRSSVISMLAKRGVACVEREVDLTELYDSDEAFLCSTGLEILPIGSLDGLEIGNGQTGPITSEIQRHYAAVVRGKSPDFSEWRTAVYGAGPGLAYATAG